MLAFALAISLYIVRYLYAEFFIDTGREGSYRLRAQGSLPLAVLTGLQGWLAYSTGLVAAAYWLWLCRHPH
ncbi:hypothetical protein A3K29_04850 [Candidatus Collierbacteria bacterium RIFOXYB2_FULL_46_14]|nr:MAG: hypothetical protein A3K29_04850 [Candidatus Collierbacteria bacterium RIFOXYB2_FULL_46_14]OGD76468.1 MAG: hypothetical protein A3K43_04850 [Candidatus Collierbacteria bacterium RIFOXYA2_FULL_46_20]OGD77804.1 MAG: hypothetical protein A3K39_04850 [Candidatus Collierbacteria bacterium RIFOXYC2_FULL_43_15]OGD82526.1 MAG: hypothetical protein A3K36_04850 [Candidatus Collierbacteria bacterium RIFOXYD2_FULL_45_13]